MENKNQMEKPTTLSLLLSELEKLGEEHALFIEPNVNDELNEGLNVWQFCHEFLSDVSKLEEQKQYLDEICDIYSKDGIYAVKDMIA